MSDLPPRPAVHFTDRRQNGASVKCGVLSAECRVWRGRVLGTRISTLSTFEERSTEGLINRNRDGATVGVAAGFGRNELDDLLRDVDTRPVQTTTVAQAQPSIDSDEDELVPFVVRGLGIRDWGSLKKS